MSVTKEIKTEICVVHVDDNRAIAEVTREYLTREDKRINYYISEKPENAIKLLSEHPVDCIISDYDMPHKNGIEFLHEVRKINPEIPFMLYTGKGSEEVASDAFSAGVNGYFQKEPHPDHYTVLANRIISIVEQKRAQKKQREHLAAIETAQDAIAILTSEDIIDFANPSMAEMYGVENESLAGTHMQDLYTDSATDRIYTEIIPAIQADGVWTGQIQAYSPSRGGFEARCTVSQADHGKRVITMSDISKQVESQRELTRYEAIVQALVDPVYVLDNKGEFVYVNDSFVNTFGYPAEQVVGQSVKIIKDKHELKKGKDNLRRVLSDYGPDSAYFETEIQHADGQITTCLDHMTKIMIDDEFTGSVGILRDISEQKDRKQKLKQQNDRVKQIASTLAHDIRNPLSVAMSELELARDEYSSSRLTKVNDSINEVERIIEDLLELVQTAETTMLSINPEPVAYNSWEQVETGESTLSVDAPKTVTADRAQLQRLFTNFFSNIIKHSDEPVSVSVGTLSDGLYIKHTGPRVPAADQDTVPKTRYATDSDGSGYGLRIVRNIVANLGWDMQITEPSSGGLCVKITDVSQSISESGTPVTEQ